jgi:hypothetical protein
VILLDNNAPRTPYLFPPHSTESIGLPGACLGGFLGQGKRRANLYTRHLARRVALSDERRAEGELLQLAIERGVWGIARLFGYQDLDSIANLRQGLQFGKP